MTKTLAIVFGVVFLLLGILGFVSSLTPDGELFGIFKVDSIHNIIHLLSGAVALWAGFTSAAASKMYFRIFGIVYAIVAILGFFQGDMVLGFIANNMADAWLHAVIAVIALYAGFMSGDETAKMAA